MIRFEAWVAGYRSKAAAARALGVSASMVSQMLSGTRQPGLKAALAIEQATRGWSGGCIRAREWLESEVA
jgi:DNA-binding transcriptional regulator YdaS (Cro superfamily)